MATKAQKHSQLDFKINPKIKVNKMSEMLCSVENMKTIKESHVLSLLRYFDLINELKEIHK